MMLKKLLFKLFQKNKGFNSLFLLIFLGSLTWVLTMVRSGICFNPYCLDGRSFWGPNGHDGIWHIALAESFNRDSFNMPVFAGEKLINYHIFFDVLLATLSKLTLIPVINLYFQVLPVIFAALTGLVTYKFVFNWTSSKIKALWATFFVYFGGSFGFLITFFKVGILGGESLFWAQQAISTLVNPPFALSVIVLFAAFLFLDRGLKEESNKLLAVSGVLFGSLIQIKVYAGVLGLTSLFAGAVFVMVRKGGLLLFKVFLTALIVSVLIFPQVDSATGSTLIFKPFWFLETMMQLSDRVGWEKFGEAMVNYKTGNMLFKFITTYTFAFFVFVVGNLGTRLVALPYIFEKMKRRNGISYKEVMISTIIIFGFIIPLFFVQSGTPWNTIQFMYYSLVCSGVYAGIGIGNFIENSKLKATIIYCIVILLIALTVPTTIGTLLYVYLPKRPPSYVSSAEIEALHFLSGQPQGVVLTYPFDSAKAKIAEKNPPRPLYLYESTAYVSALSKHDVFLEDEVNLNITGYDWKTRRAEVVKWHSETDADEARKFLSKNSISYIYWVKEEYDDISQRAILGDLQLGLTNIFENTKVVIYKVN